MILLDRHPLFPQVAGWLTCRQKDELLLGNR